MKKKITQWFCGLMLSACGGSICASVVGVVKTFIGMMNSTGKDFIGNFILFIITLLAFIFTPYIIFHITKDGVQDKFK